jgi:septal ring factor EnvC (AmiA/AmiB activator)
MTNDKHIQYRSFCLANKTGLFQEELYPPFMNNKAANTYADWAAGIDKPANMKQLTESDMSSRRPTLVMDELNAEGIAGLAALGIKPKAAPVDSESSDDGAKKEEI